MFCKFTLFSRNNGSWLQKKEKSIQNMKNTIIFAKERNLKLLKKMRHLLLAISMMLAPMAMHADGFESAADAVKNMGVGWNLGNTLDSWSNNTYTSWQDQEKCWGQPITTPELITMMKNAGFNAIRVPVTWFKWMDTNGTVADQWMNRVHEVVDYVIENGMYCILNVHHDTGAGDQAWLIADETVYQNTKQRFENLWQQIAEEFKDYDEHLLFEAYNEMLDIKKSWCFASFAASGQYDASIAQSAYNAINNYAQSFVNVVRATGGNNTYRNLIINTYAAACGSGNWNTHLTDPLSKLNMPTDVVSGHIAFEVHTYPNIQNLSNAKSEMNDMVNKLNTYLVSKGAPVIIGEWGTSNVDAGEGKTDYDIRRTAMLNFVDFFVKKMKSNNIATFYWMGLSDGWARSLPAFNQPDLAETIAKAYHGEDFQGVYPSMEEQQFDYQVVYTGDWQELNLYSGSAITLSNYTGIKVVMADETALDKLQVKIYSSNEAYKPLTGIETLVSFDSSMGTTTQRITLQTIAGACTATLREATLIKKDGTEVELTPSVFWGCSVTPVPRTTGIFTPFITEANDGNIYNLSGQRVQTLSKGIHIKNGKKFVVK
jgi:hypothetical protein